MRAIISSAPAEHERVVLPDESVVHVKSDEELEAEVRAEEDAQIAKAEQVRRKALDEGDVKSADEV